MLQVNYMNWWMTVSKSEVKESYLTIFFGWATNIWCGRSDLAPRPWDRHLSDNPGASLNGMSIIELVLSSLGSQVARNLSQAKSGVLWYSPGSIASQSQATHNQVHRLTMRVFNQSNITCIFLECWGKEGNTQKPTISKTNLRTVSCIY